MTSGHLRNYTTLTDTTYIFRGFAHKKRGQVMGDHSCDCLSPFAPSVGIPGTGRPVLKVNSCSDQLKNMMVAVFGIHEHLRQWNMK